MKKRILFLFPILLLSSCQDPDAMISSSITSAPTSSIKSDEPLSSSSTVLPSSSSASSSSLTTVVPSTSTTTPTTTPLPSTSTIIPSTSSFVPSTTTIASSSTGEDEIIYNPDGSQRLPVPTSEVKETWGKEETKYSFLESFPEGFHYIYGHRILNQANFYQDTTKGWKISVPNSSARLGFQTPLFVSDLKIEIRLYLSGVYNSNNKVDEDEPWLRVYGFNKKGELTQIKEVECPKNFYNYKNSKTPINFYMSGEDVDYLEVRFTAAPYKGTQCYNFGIKEIGFKTFPYAYDGD